MNIAPSLEKPKNYFLNKGFCHMLYIVNGLFAFLLSQILDVYSTGFFINYTS